MTFMKTLQKTRILSKSVLFIFKREIGALRTRDFDSLKSHVTSNYNVVIMQFNINFININW